MVFYYSIQQLERTKGNSKQIHITTIKFTKFIVDTISSSYSLKETALHRYIVAFNLIS